jgi:hypothetical protein
VADLEGYRIAADGKRWKQKGKNRSRFQIRTGASSHPR